MKRFCNTYKHIISGYLLLVVLVYAIAAKGIHTHIVSDVNHHAQSIQSGDFCDICDFQFTGSGVISFITVDVAASSGFILYSPAITSAVHSGNILPISGRGPPFLL